MSRYRKLHVRMYADEKFRQLSAPPPNAQTLWVYLIAGPIPTYLPGLFTVGEAALAEALGWPLEGFREAFRELFEKGMAKADWKARVVWVPKALSHNPPENPNVVTSWVRSLDEIPECALKNEAVSRFRAVISTMGKGFRDALAKGLPEPFAKGLPNQEQEQQQYQKQEHSPQGVAGSLVTDGEPEPGNKTAIPEKSPPELPPGFLAFWAAWPRHHRKTGRSDCASLWKRQKLEPLAARVVAALASSKASPDWLKEAGAYIPEPIRWLKKTPWETDPSDLMELGGRTMSLRYAGALREDR